MQNTTTIEQVMASDWQSWARDHDATVLDVREPHEWAATGVLPGSELISLGELPRSLDRLDRSKPLLVVCRSGNRSQTAAEFLTAAGYRAANLAGGVLAIASR
jgi:rhodanese-related sulfurtransferase